MNKRIDELTKEAFDADIKVFDSTEFLRKTLINLKIIASSLDPENREVIKVFASTLEDNIKVIQNKTFEIKEIIKEIAVVNKKCCEEDK